MKVIKIAPGKVGLSAAGAVKFQECPLTTCSLIGKQAAPVEEEVFENERYIIIRGWSPRNLLPTDRARFSYGRSQPASASTTEFPKVPLPKGAITLHSLGTPKAGFPLL